MDDVLIMPPEGGLKETARLLLTLAGDVPEVVRTTNAGNAFLVPAALADAYHAAVSASAPAPARRTARTKKGS